MRENISKFINMVRAERGKQEKQKIDTESNKQQESKEAIETKTLLPVSRLGKETLDEQKDSDAKIEVKKEMNFQKMVLPGIQQNTQGNGTLTK